jgi:hypothetical protein
MDRLLSDSRMPALEVDRDNVLVVSKIREAA